MIFSNKEKNNRNSKEDPFSIFDSIAEKKKQEIYNKINNTSDASNSIKTKSDIDMYDQKQSFIGQKTQQISVMSGENDNAGVKCDSFLVGTAKSIGRRKSQQDEVAISENTVINSFNGKWLGVLCDGMGGMNGGEKASSLCVKITIDYFRDFILKNNMNIPQFYKETIVKADYEVSALEDENGCYLGAGTTFVSVIIDNNKLYYASVGDSHIYVIRKNNIKMIVKEHNYFSDLLEMVQSGEITYEEACADKSKDALTSYIGIGNVNLMDVAINPIALERGDIILLCSDGLYRSVSDSEILNIVSKDNLNMNSVAQRLVDFALMKNNPYQDNTSVVIAKYQ